MEEDTPPRALVDIHGLKVAYRDHEVLHGIDLQIHRGDIYAVVGASGSGKSTLISAILGLYAREERITGGSIEVLGKELKQFSAKNWRAFRREQLGYIPQDPVTNLNPSMRIGDQIADAIRVRGKTSRNEVHRRVLELMSNVGIDEPERRVKQYPHEFSGGMCQRILIAIALSRNPNLIVADEPTSALDVTVQKTILDHMVELVKEHGTTMLFITHNLALAAERADKIAVMHEGNVLEFGDSKDVIKKPKTEYTQSLINAAPGLKSLQHWNRRVQSPDADPTPALFIDDVVKSYKIRGGQKRTLLASDHVSFSVQKGTTTALVGESGSGKTTLARIILGLELPTSGRIILNGELVDAGDAKRMYDVRTVIQPVFQNPYGSLDPTYRIADIIREPLDVIRLGTKQERDELVAKLLTSVDLSEEISTRYPSELSGGQRQRVAIARALAINPQILILDEAVSALDVLVQDQILTLLRSLQESHELTYLFITHDLGVAQQFADNVVILRHGVCEEQGDIKSVFNAPQSQYTRKLLDAIPKPKFPI